VLAALFDRMEVHGTTVAVVQ